MKSQKERILNLLKEHPEGVSCRRFQDEFLFHKLASRCSELRVEGYDIQYVPDPNGEVMKAKYVLRDGVGPNNRLTENKPETSQGTPSQDFKVYEEKGQMGLIFETERFD